MQILSPAGSLEALKAAVWGGADAVYLGAPTFNARMGAQNFASDELREGIRFCHERGVQVHATLNTLVSDRELPQALDVAAELVQDGADALIVQDLGLARALVRRTDVPLHASTQLTAHSLDGVRFLADLGFTRVVLSRELDRDNIAYICAHAPAEIEVFCHGALCMCYSGQCYMSSVIGLRSGNRGKCAQPCRLPYENGYALSLKDMCLLRDVCDLTSLGVSCVKIEGRMKVPSYVYAVTRAYADAKRGKPYDPDEERYLADVFSRDGFTRGYYLKEKGREMFGVRSETTQNPTVEQKEYKRFSLDVDVTVRGTEARLCARSSDGYAAEDTIFAETAQNRPTTEDDLVRQLGRLGDTVYTLGAVKMDADRDVFFPAGALNAARRRLLERLTAMRLVPAHGFDRRPLERVTTEPANKTDVEGYFLSLDSVPKTQESLSRLWFPLALAPEAAKRYGERVGAVLPPVITDAETVSVRRRLAEARDAGIEHVLVNNVGGLSLVRSAGLTPHGDFGLNIFNAQTRDVYETAGLASVTLSFEMNDAMTRDVADEKSVVIAYGRLPFMLCENCPQKHCGKTGTLRDRTGRAFLLTCEPGCRARVWNADRLYLADRGLPPAGAVRLLFTDETAEEADRVVRAYTGEPFEMPALGYTRGLVNKKV